MSGHHVELCEVRPVNGSPAYWRAVVYAAERALKVFRAKTALVAQNAARDWLDAEAVGGGT